MEPSFSLGRFSRRRFLRTGAGLGLGAAAGSILWDALWSREAVAAAPLGLPEIDAFLSPDQVRELLQIGLARGGDFSEVYAEYTLQTTLTVDQGKLSTVEVGVLSGVGVRVLAGGQVGYAYADDYDMANLRRAAEVASAIARGGQGGKPQAFAVSKARAPFTVRSPAPLALSEEKKIALIERANEVARAVDPRVTQVTASWGDNAKRMLVANSEGVFETDEQFLSRLTVQALATETGKRNFAVGSIGGNVEADFYAPAVETCARGAAKNAVELLGAEEPRAGTYPVVIAPGWGGVLVHECFGHSLEGDGIRQKTSIRAFQLGKPVAAKGIDIYDDGTVPNGRGSFKVDDEGTPSRKNQVVRDGVLVGYLWDRLSLKNADASLTQGATLSGNGRRESYREFPIPRMTNTYLGNGTRDPKDVIGEVKDGLYCADMQGGSVNPSDGTFSFACTLSYKIENGKLTKPVKNVTLTGNGADAMMQIDALGNDLAFERGRGTCGKEGQWKPVGVGQPTVRFTGFTVGGSRTA
ncbi:MAG: TldD/PmbA family protein [bacterium]